MKMTKHIFFFSFSLGAMAHQPLSNDAPDDKND